MAQLLASLLSGVPSPPFLSSLLLSSLFVHIEVAGRCGGRGREGAAGRALSKPAERGRPKQVLRFPAPERLRGRGGQARPDAENYISHNPVTAAILAGGRWQPRV